MNRRPFLTLVTLIMGIIISGPVLAKDALQPIQDHKESLQWSAPGSPVASGVLQAEILRQEPHESTIQLVFPSNEEYGQLGSRAFADRLREEGVNIGCAINVDVVGYNRPSALLSRAPFSLLGHNYTMKRKAKMLAKMAYNGVASFRNRSAVLKVVARTEDAHFLPANLYIGRLLARNRARRITGDLAPRGDEGPFWAAGYHALCIHSVYRNPYSHTPQDAFEHVDVDTVVRAAHLTLSLLLYWDTEFKENKSVQ